jgi:mono/diheme cytochrome c family protein
MRRIAAAALLFISTGCGGPTGPGSDAPGDFDWWRGERRQRQERLSAYLETHHLDYQSFKNAPLGSSGVPIVLFRLFPELMPDIWGTPSEGMAPQGFGPDLLEPDRVLPLGLGHTPSNTPLQTPSGPVRLGVVNLTCMGCHGGRVVGPDGKVQVLIGAPNTQFNQFRWAVNRTVLHPAYTADTFRNALAAKPMGWLYGDSDLLLQEVVERSVFMAPGAAEQFLDNLKTRALSGTARIEATLGAYPYAVPNAPSLWTPKSGYLDAVVGLAPLYDTSLPPGTLRTILPPAPAEVDIMSTWMQVERPAGQWDGSMPAPIHRNIGAEFAIVGSVPAVNLDNAIRGMRLDHGLPPPPYPFDVDGAAAQRGQGLYERHCLTCHHPGNATIYPAEQVGTDPNRARVWSPSIVATLAGSMREACADPVACSNADGTPLRTDQILRSTGGYMALPLAGIWARAPYLHNGSVPTLHALLTGDRPRTFWRGNLTYDRAKVGFSYEQPSAGATFFDTSLSGASNAGHDTREVNGPIDWARDTAALHDMLEYLKTL